MNTQTYDSSLAAAAAAAKPAPRRSRLRRLLVALLYAIPLLALIVAGANQAWLMSGSNTWELKIDKDGTQVYTMKTPGAYGLKIRGVTQTKEFSLSNHIAPLLDESIQNDCGKWVEGCLSYKIVQPWNPRTQSNVTMWTVKLPPPFSPRQMLLQGQLTQDPVTKVVTLENVAVPNKLPPDPCCVRVQQLHNVWHYTPMADGNIKIELLYDLSMGGGFPQLLLNLGAPAAVHKMLTEQNPALLRKPQYRDAHLDFLDETPAAPATAAAQP